MENLKNMDLGIYNRNTIVSDEKTLTVYLMLEANQKVTYEVFYNIFGASPRTFNRVIATIKQSLENIGEYETQIIYNRETLNYVLVKASYKV